MSSLDDMQKIWVAQNDKLDRLVRLNAKLLEDASLGGARPALRRLQLWQWGAAAIWTVVLVGIGSFAADHRSTPLLFASAILSGIYALWMLNAAVRQAMLVQNMDFTRPVSTLLDQAGALRVHRIRQTQIAILAGIVAWAPFFVVVCDIVSGVEITSVLWLVANIGVGLTASLAWFLVARRYADRLTRWPAAQRVMNDVAGRHLNEASRFLADLAIFRAEPRD